MEHVQTKTLELHQKCEQFSKFTNLKISKINSQLQRVFNAGKGPQNPSITLTTHNTHKWKEPSPSFMVSPTSVSQSFISHTSACPSSATAIPDDDIISVLSDNSLLVNSFSPSSVTMSSRNAAYKPENQNRS